MRSVPDSTPATPRSHGSVGSPALQWIREEGRNSWDESGSDEGGQDNLKTVAADVRRQRREIFIPRFSTFITKDLGLSLTVF
jgi:hypothetical protein